MKQKLLLLILALFCTVGAWAFDVTVINSSESETTYGSLSSGTFTTNGTSGLSGVTVSGVTLLKGTSFAYGSSLGFEKVTSGTITLSAPEGYTILGYSLTARSNTWSVSYTLTPAAGGSAVTTSTSGVTLVASGVNSRTTTIAYTASSQNSFYIPSLVISIKSDAAENVNVVYKEVYDGVVKRTNDPVSQVVGEAPGLPSGLQTAGCTYKYYTTEACTGEELSTLTSSTTEVYAKVTFTAFTFSSGFDGATWYYVYFNRDAGKRYWQMDPNTTPYPDKSSKPSVSEALWAFTGNPYDGIKVMNARAGDGYYLKKTGTSSGAAITMQEGGDTWAIGTGDGGFTLKQDGTNVFIHDYSTQLAVWNSGSAANDKGSAIVVEAASPVKVTYKLTYNGNVISSYTKDLYELVGATAAAPFDWVLPAYCSLGACTPSTIAAETTEVTIPLVWDGPFEFSTNYESAVWYYMTLGGKWATYIDNDTQSLTDELQSGDASLWAFIGNPYDGIQVINKDAGDGLYLLADQSSRMVNSDHAFYSYTVYEITEKATGFTMKESGGNYFYAYGDDIAWSANGELAEDVFTVRSYYCQQALDDLADYASENAVGEYFGVRQESIDLIKSMFENMPKMTATDYTTYAVPSGVSAYLNIKYPATGYYRIKSAGTRAAGAGYITYGEVYPTYGYSLVVNPSGINDPSSVIHLTKVSDGIYTFSLQGLNVQATSESAKVLANGEDAAVNYTIAQVAPGYASIGSGTGRNYFHEASWTGSGYTYNPVVGWDAPASGNDASAWIIEDAESLTITMNPVSVTTGSFATICFPFDVTIESPSASGGAIVYTVSIESSRAKMNALGSQNVPAGTPVLLAGAYTTDKVTATITSGIAAYDGTNALRGTYFDKTTLAENEYVFGTSGGELGFWKLGTGYKVGANKAYLVVPAGGGVKGFALDFDDDATAIKDLNDLKDSKDFKVYNLAGQRLNKMQKGINIVNGKKVLR